MTTLADTVPELPSRMQYARFSRRLRGMFIDWVLALVLVFGAILIAVSVGSAVFSRILAVAVALFFVLYEPLLVSRTGGTVGHWVTNLRVVDDRTGGNLTLRTAFIRAAIKAVLGAYSFIIMLATRRNQAVHDLLTHSTVQIRDAAKAAPHHFIVERSELLSPTMPSARRRIAAIAVYFVLALLAYIIAFAILNELGVISDGCIDNDVCSTTENVLQAATGIVILVSAAIVIGLGWRGRLYGARRIA